RTASCLVRLRPEGVSLPFAGLFTRCLACANLALVRFLRCGIWRIHFRLRRHPAPSPPKPRSGGIASGAGSARAKRPIYGSHTDASFAPEVQAFLPFRFDGRLRDRRVRPPPACLVLMVWATSIRTSRNPVRRFLNLGGAYEHLWETERACLIFGPARRNSWS